LESFGNARTVRNDNSSRFGKFIEMQFTSTGRLVGTKIDTYLLEKVRVVSQNPGERNYHVFYELLSGAVPPEELQQLCLDATVKPQHFRILNSGTFDRRDGVSDRDTYKDLRKALNMMGFTDEERQDVFALTAAILHASNLTFVEIENEESALQKDNKHLQPACDLFGLTPEALNDALCYFSITDPRGKSIRRPNVVEKAEKGLDALLKAAYGALFTFLVQKVNEKIAFIDTPGTEARHVASIGVLDIFGFESFTTNSFEQLCINYCNEALQQQFNTFMLKNEQAEYANEGIDWNFIKFPENQDVLDLIDHRTSGIMSILDDMCRAPGATDSAFVSQVYKLCDGKDRFEVSRQNTSSLQFSIHHYAGPVEYTTIGFVEKNRDDLPRETAELLMKSKNPFVHKLAEIIFASGQATPASDTVTTKSRRDTNNNSRPSVGGHFRQQVKDLRAKIDTTAPHYVRCIKPNELLVQNRFDDAMVAQQLRCGGILQAVGVTRDGFTLHYTHSDFINRYGILTGDKSSKKEPSANRFGSNKSAREECKQLVDTMLQKLHKMEVKDEKPVDSKTSAANESTEVEDKLIEFGKSKVLMKHHAFEALERMLGAIENRGATRLNTNFRRFLARTAFLSARESFRKELQVLGQSFDEWFQEHRALYYRSRRKTGKIEIQDIVKHRKQLYKKNTESFSPAPASKKKVSTEKQAWIEINGAWARNPDYKP
jgi:myosin-5